MGGERAVVVYAIEVISLSTLRLLTDFGSLSLKDSRATDGQAISLPCLVTGVSKTEEPCDVPLYPVMAAANAASVPVGA